MTLREDIIKYSGETLEEGKFGRGLTIALMIAALAFGAFKGVPAAKQIYNQYKHASSETVASKYMDADYEANRAFENWERNINIYTDFSPSSKKSILNIDIEMYDYVHKVLDEKTQRTEVASELWKIITAQLDRYIASIKSNSSKLEKLFNKEGYIGDSKPLKVQLDFKMNKRYLEQNSDTKAEFEWLSKTVGWRLASEISKKIGIPEEYIDIYINGQSAAFKK